MLIEDLIVSEDMSVIDAMKKLNETGKKILFIAPDMKLQAVITDSDIRRHILHGGKLEAPVSQMANYNPIYLNVGSRSGANDCMVQNSISALPLLDTDGNIVDVVFADESKIKTKKAKGLPVVIMAGGLGTRLYPYTKILPKPLIPVGEKPIVEHIITRFKAFGCTDFKMIVNHKRNMIKAYFNEIDDKDYTVDFVDEDKFLGTGGGLSLLKGKIDTPFFLTNCVVLIEADYNDIIKFHNKNKNLITVVCALKHVTIPYGVFTMGENGEIDSVTEKPTMNFLTNTGMYLVDPKVIDDLQPDTAVSFPDIMEKYRSLGYKVGVYPVSEESWMDMGQLEELEAMRRKLENQ